MFAIVWRLVRRAIIDAFTPHTASHASMRLSRSMDPEWISICILINMIFKEKAVMGMSGLTEVDV